LPGLGDGHAVGVAVLHRASVGAARKVRPEPAPDAPRERLLLGCVRQVHAPPVASRRRGGNVALARGHPVALRSGRVRLVAPVLLLAGAVRGFACPVLPVAPDSPNAVEMQLGATNINAALGNGGLTAAYSQCGELTVLKWPGPSFYDQLDYLTSNASD